jgi:hypothetical protein
MQPADHVDRQAPTTIEHFSDASPAADDAFEILAAS